jgi:hypothetical protein
MRFSIPGPDDAAYQEYIRRFQHLEQSAIRLDAQYRIPLTRIHIGWDPLIGVIPVAGDLVAAFLSIRFVHQAYRLGAEARLIRRMMLNVIIDALLGAIPVIGFVFDVWFRANVRNLHLMIDALAQSSPPPERNTPPR